MLFASTSHTHPLRCLSMILGVILTAGLSPVRAKTWCVDDDHASDPGPGNSSVSNALEDGSFEAPFDAIQEAIDAAVCSDVVMVMPGTYGGVGNFNLNYLGKCITVRSAQGPEATIIDALLAGRGVRFVSGESSLAVLEGFTITNGKAFSPGNNLGGGISIINSDPTIRRCALTGNSVGGLFAEGGGIYLQNSDARIEGCRVVNNSVSGSLSFGAGMFISGGSPTIVDSIIADNRAGLSQTTRGGGVVVDAQAMPTFLRTQVVGNQAGFGGGMVFQASSGGLVDSCIIENNQADESPGILLSNGASPTIRNSLIVGNDVTNADTSEPPGGGIDCYEETTHPLIINCTIVNNLVSGVACLGANPVIKNCVVSGHETDLMGCTASYSCIGNGGTGETNPPIAGDPMFDMQEGRFRLHKNSPCVDAGSPAFTPTERETDLDGHARVLCGRVDIGAYESGMGDSDCNDFVDLFDFADRLMCQTDPQNTEVLADGCEVFDFNADDSVDLHDYAGFARIFTDGSE